ncbi:MAG: ABC transporter ATP-binding protein [Gemmataceae bacterium]|nr:ABC transporter ATP-binding protein [Gemmataceae bacterium]
MIQVENLSKHFGPVVAVDRVSFQVGRGEIVGFLGLNGAGKSTTMKILTGYLPATSGIARVAGFDVMTQSLDVRRNIGYLPENVPLYPEMRVEEYVAFRAKLKGVPRRERAARIDFCLDRCRLREVKRRLLGTLSKGYRQRVGLADAMVHNPPILILDEPTSGFDPLQKRETLTLIKEFGEKRTVLLSTHILSEVEAICDRVIMIARGRVGLSRTLDDLEPTAAVLVETKATEAEIRQALATLEEVRAVRCVPDEEGWLACTVETERDVDARAKIGETIAARGWPLRRLERKRVRLEDAFFDVLRAQDPAQAPDEPGATLASSEAYRRA